MSNCFVSTAEQLDWICHNDVTIARTVDR